MTDTLTHRGPDGSGYYYDQTGDSGVGLGHRRLSIIDVAGGQQPILNEDETVAVVCNGEIYNFQELRDRLIQRGHIFRTKSDSEVLVHLYEDFGEEMLHHLNGMFAFAIWDKPRKILFLARDRIGKKPLVYALSGNCILFASQLRAIVETGFPKEVNPDAVNDFLLYGYVPHPHTILKGIHKLPPAHYAIYQNGKLRIERYWDPSSIQELHSSLDEQRQRICELLKESTRLRLVSDVPLGAFLSGGVDSTIIVGLMQSISPSPVKTYSIGFPVANYDERQYARVAAKAFGTTHHEKEMLPAFFDTIPEIAYHYDEPFADASSLPTYLLSQFARGDVTVALTGDGGDELFAGYGWHRRIKLTQQFDGLPKTVKKLLTLEIWHKFVGLFVNRQTNRKISNLIRLLKENSHQRYLHFLDNFDEPMRQTLLTDQYQETLSENGPEDFLLDAYRRSTNETLLSQTLFVDLTTYLPADLLVKVDIASMAHGLECRSPFLDYRFIEYAMSIPSNLKLRGRSDKWILKQAFSHLIPEPLKNRKKMGFSVPLDDWFRGPLHNLLHEVLLGERSLYRDIIRREAVQKLIEEHQSNERNHGRRLWSLVVLENWFRAHIDQ